MKTSPAPLKVQPRYNPAQVKPPNIERFGSTIRIVSCRCSAYSSGTALIKSSCNLIGKSFEIDNKNISPNRYLKAYEIDSIYNIDNFNLDFFAYL